MCYAKPGPRCTKHAYNKLVSSKKRLEKTKEALNRAEQEAINSSYSPASVRKLNRARVSYMDRVAAMQEANREFSSTPGGLEKLDEAIKEAARRNNNQELEYLVRERKDAVNLRASQLKAYEDKMKQERLEEARVKIAALNTQRRQVFARSPNLSYEELRLLIQDEDHNVRAAAFSNKLLAPKFIEMGSHSKNPVIRAGVARNPNATTRQLQVLGEDFDDLVRNAARCHPNYQPLTEYAY